MQSAAVCNQLRRGRAAERGSALVPALFIMISLAGLCLVSTMTRTQASTSLRTVDEIQRLETIGESALELAMNEIWSGYLRSQGGVPGSLGTFQTYLDFLGIPVASGGRGQAFLANQRAHPDGIDARQFLDPTAGPGDMEFAGADIHSLRVMREDLDESVLLRFDLSVGFQDEAAGLHSREMGQVFTITGEDFEGFNFALLANNINCIMCHALIDDAQRSFNTDARRHDTFDKVRVGSLESLQIRPSGANTVIAGTIYSRGPILTDHGDLITNISGTTLDSVRMLPGGKIDELHGGLLQRQDLTVTADPMTPGGNLYANYPTDPALQGDGYLPDRFPPVVPDTNGNRAVDPEEFDQMIAQSRGVIEGGRKTVVEHGQLLGSTGLPTGDSAGRIDALVDGNLVLVGTESDPIRINGRVSVRGDVVIAGYVLGDGEIVSSGNTYVVGPVLYKDGTNAEGRRIFGRSAEGRMNRLALGAAGNIVVGNFEEKASWLGNNATTFTERQLMTFNRAEWQKTQPTLPGPNGTVVVNPTFDPTHRPRYYAMEPNGPIHIWTGGRCYFDPGTNTWHGDETYSNWNHPGRTTLNAGDPLLATAVIQTIRPETSWFSSAQLRRMWTDGQDFAANARGLQVDGLLYTSNMAMWLAARSGFYNGMGQVNGSIVAADVGILLPGDNRGSPGLILNYDRRLRGSLGIRSLERVEIAKALRVY